MCGEPQVSYARLQEILQGMKTLGNFNDDLLEVMHTQLAEQNWRCVDLLVGIIHWNPNRKFTSLLCDLLDNHKENVNIEDIADTLDYIHDERSVPSLINALDYYVPGDDDRHFNKKLLYALARIGSEEAIAGLKLAAQSQEEEIRETARQELLRLEIPFD